MQQADPPNPPAPTREPGPVVRGATVIHLPLIKDFRGTLSFGQAPEHFAFAALRYFVVTDVTPGSSRGDHAHRVSRQLLVCVGGSCVVDVDDGTRRGSVLLDSPGVGLRLDPMVWRVMRDFTPGSTLLVMTSDCYDEAEYIRDYDTFRRAAGVL